MKKLWIGGELIEADSGESFEVENPATEEILDTAPRAVEAAAHAFQEWWKVPGSEKADLLHDVANRLRKNKGTIAHTMTEEGGKPLLENIDEVDWCAACFDYYAEIGRNDRGRVIAPVREHQFNFVVKEPYGVVAAIVPWNYPLLLLCWKLAPALAAGNTVVVKPSEYTPLSTLMLDKVFDGLPPGTVNVITGHGETGEALVTHPRVDVVVFTGSVEIGRAIARAAADQLKKLHLELGGNDPFIVCDDVDVDVAAQGAAFAAFLNMGQVCNLSGAVLCVRESRGSLLGSVRRCCQGSTSRQSHGAGCRPRAHGQCRATGQSGTEAGGGAQGRGRAGSGRKETRRPFQGLLLRADRPHRCESLDEAHERRNVRTDCTHHDRERHRRSDHARQRFQIWAKVPASIPITSNTP